MELNPNDVDFEIKHYMTITSKKFLFYDKIILSGC